MVGSNTGFGGNLAGFDTRFGRRWPILVPGWAETWPILGPIMLLEGVRMAL